MIFRELLLLSQPNQALASKAITLIRWREALFDILIRIKAVNSCTHNNNFLYYSCTEKSCFLLKAFTAIGQVCTFHKGNATSESTTGGKEVLGVCQMYLYWLFKFKASMRIWSYNILIS